MLYKRPKISASFLSRFFRSVFPYTLSVYCAVIKLSGEVFYQLPLTCINRFLALSLLVVSLTNQTDGWSERKENWKFDYVTAAGQRQGTHVISY